MIIRAAFYCFCFVLLWSFVPAYAGGNEQFTPETETLTIITQDNKRHDFQVELATTPAEWKHGLMYRTEMATDHGMLFIFPEERMRSFWMKNTFIPLDILFLRRNGEIINISENAQPLDLTSNPSTEPALAVLEINGGICKKQGIKAGDIVHHPFFNNEMVAE